MWRWVKSGLFKVSVTPGGHHRILKDDLVAFLTEYGMYPLATRHFPKNRLLVVDDDATLRKVLVEVLSSYKYETEEAEDGFEAGVKILKFKPDIIILDLLMPGMDGFQVCTYLKNDPKTSGIKILALTGYDTEENRERIMKAGADEYLTKPVEADTLFPMVRKLLGEESISPR